MFRSPAKPDGISRLSSVPQSSPWPVSGCRGLAASAWTLPGRIYWSVAAERATASLFRGLRLVVIPVTLMSGFSFVCRVLGTWVPG